MIIYILHKYNRTELLGTTPDEKVRIATAAAIYWDLLEDYYELVYGQYDERLTSWQEARETFVNQKFRLKLNRMASFLQSKYWESSEEFTWIDFALAEMVTILNEMSNTLFQFGTDYKQKSAYVQKYLVKVFESPQFRVYR